MPFLSATVQVHQNTDRLYVDQSLKVQYEIPYQKEERPLLTQFFLQLKPFPFRLVSSKVGENKELLLDFELKPTQIGTNIFTPGPLYYGLNEAVILPAIKVDCIATGLSLYELPPLLPLHPESKITLSAQNRSLIQAPERLLREKEKSEELVERYNRAWELLYSILMALGGGALLLWGCVQYVLFRTRPQPVVPVDMRAELLREAQDPSLALSERFHKILLLMREDARLAPLIPRLEAICFGNAPTSEEEWSHYLEKLK